VLLERNPSETLIKFGPLWRRWKTARPFSSQRWPRHRSGTSAPDGDDLRKAVREVGALPGEHLDAAIGAPGHHKEPVVADLMNLSQPADGSLAGRGKARRRRPVGKMDAHAHATWALDSHYGARVGSGPGMTLPQVRPPMLIPARNIPRIHHIPRDRTRATANRGMWGKGGKISP
jgi:hypothetical protein